MERKGVLDEVKEELEGNRKREARMVRNAWGRFWGEAEAKRAVWDVECGSSGVEEE